MARKVNLESGRFELLVRTDDLNMWRQAAAIEGMSLAAFFRETVTQGALEIVGAGAAEVDQAERQPSWRQAIYTLVWRAIRSGELVRQPCEQCGCTTVVAHHDDYAQPLAVRWLCNQHHADWHKSNRAKNHGVDHASP